jgi:hypothetical protein
MRLLRNLLVKTADDIPNVAQAFLFASSGRTGTAGNNEANFCPFSALPPHRSSHAPNVEFSPHPNTDDANTLI